MKSLLISKEYFPPQIGGISTMMWEICRALGPERVCALTAVQAHEGLPSRMEGIRVFRKTAPFAKNRLRQVAGLASAMAEIGVSERVRLLQLSSCDEAYLGYYLKRLFHVPYVVYAHGNDILSAARNEWPAARNGLRGATRVIANSQYSAGLLRNIGVDPARINVIHPGCNVDRFFPTVPTDRVLQYWGPQVRDRCCLPSEASYPARGKTSFCVHYLF